MWCCSLCIVRLLFGVVRGLRLVVAFHCLLFDLFVDCACLLFIVGVCCFVDCCFVVCCVLVVVY